MIENKTILCFRNFAPRGSHFEHGHPSYHDSGELMQLQCLNSVHVTESVTRLRIV